eukprot:g4301.t1
MRKYENKRSLSNRVIPNFPVKDKPQTTSSSSSLKTYENASQLSLKDSDWERCSECERVLDVTRFSANQMEKVKPRCIQCVASDLHLKKSRSKNKRKRSKNERDTTLRRDNDPFLAIRDALRRRGDYALEDDHTLPGANISEGNIVSKVGHVQSGNTSQQQTKKERQAAEYALILEKREREKEQLRKRMEASKTSVACIYFAKGHCIRGTECPYSHDLTIATKSQIPCIFFRNGQCKRGKDCAFRHDVRDNITKDLSSAAVSTTKKDTFDMTYSFILDCSSSSNHT